MNNVSKKLLCSLAAAASFAVTASAQLQVGGVGSSAMFNTASTAAYQLAGGSAGGAGHFTAKNAAQIIDTRDANIVNQKGNLSVVWNAAQTKAWYYLSVDSVVGNRAYFAQPRTTLQLIGGVAAGNLISAGLWGTDAASIPVAVQTLINNSQFNTAFTDILPADAKFAQNRVNCGTATTATLGCLGYGTSDSHVGANIASAFSTATAQPVDFNIFGNDPITNAAIPAFTVTPIGIAPIVFLVNRTNPAGFGSGSFTDITYQATAQLLFTGINCDGTAFGGSSFFAINPILREPLSGTMNTIEYNVFVQNQQGNVANFDFSQEGTLVPPYNVPSNFVANQPATNNPLNGACPGGNNGYASGPQGARKRAIGTGEEVSSVKATADSIGYAFFSYGNVSPLANNSSYGYLDYESVDPINPSGSYGTAYSAGGLLWPGNGLLPTCTAPCPIAPNASFPNIRNGAFRAWSLLRGVADTGSAASTNLTALATEIQNEVNNTVPDFVPFNPAADGDSGFIGYRSHFAPPGVNFNASNTPNNGITNPAAEAGGDVGGCLDYKSSPNTLNCRY